MHAMILFLGLTPAAGCEGALASVCSELAAGRYLAAAAAATPIAQDPTQPARERQAAVSIAVGAFLREGSPASRCDARRVLERYLGDHLVPHPPALQQRLRELVDDECDLLPIVRRSQPLPARSTSSTPGPAVAPALAAAPRRATTRADMARRALGTTLVSLGGGLVGVSLGALGVMLREASRARGLVDLARNTGQDLSREAFVGHFQGATQARDVAVGVGIAGASTLVVGVVCLLVGRRSAGRWAATSAGLAVRF